MKWGEPGSVHTDSDNLGAEVMKKREGEEGNWKASEEKEGGRGRKGEWVC